MRLYLSQAFTWGVPTALTGESGHIRYRLTGDAYSLGRRLHVTDLAGREAVYIRQVIPSLFPRYALEVYGRPVGALSRTPAGEYVLEPPELTLEGDPHARQASVLYQGRIAAACRPGEGETLLLSLDSPEHGLTGLAVLLAVLLADSGKNQKKSPEIVDFFPSHTV